MSRLQRNNRCKTMRNLKVVNINFVKDESIKSEERTVEVTNLLAQMIGLSHKRGRPIEKREEVEDVA